ncbi:MAG: hypothetical protein EOP09_15765, partial [Proteobacteria bacterium]
MADTVTYTLNTGDPITIDVTQIVRIYRRWAEDDTDFNTRIEGLAEYLVKELPSEVGPEVSKKLKSLIRFTAPMGGVL